MNQFNALCVSMQKTSLAHLLLVLDNLAEGNVINQVSVDAETAENARVALQRMVDIKGVTKLTKK